MVRRTKTKIVLGVLILPFFSPIRAQSPGSAGTLEGTVTDPSGAAIVGATVSIRNRLTGFRRSVSSDPQGAFRLANLPPNTYHVEVDSPGFSHLDQDVVVRSNVPQKLKLTLRIAGSETTVTVEEHESELLENVPYAHNDVAQQALSKLPTTSPGSGLSDAITMSSPGVVADSNGFFHPLGDHAQTTFSVDGQPISDQQNKQFSTQIPLNALQSMELITGAPSAEFGDKTSLVVNAVTRSGLGQKAHGSLDLGYGSFGSPGEEATFGIGSAKWGNFLAANSLRSGRFLDTPEFRPFHAAGNNYTIFDRVDFQPDTKDALHLNLFHARNWFQVPNTYDQLIEGQDQRQKSLTYNIAPGYQRTVNSQMLLTVNPFWRQDQVSYYPSRDPFADTPATLGESRRLMNWGVRSDVSLVRGVQNLKAGIQLMQTRLGEHFQLGITDPGFVDPVEQPGLLPYDLTRGGQLFLFSGRKNINQYAFFVQDTITLGQLSINGGLRVDRYNGLSQATGIQPRVGFSYLLKPSRTVFRVAYSHTMETPYNENLILSSATGQGGLASSVFGAYGSQPILPGRRNQYNTGIAQSVGKWLLIDADYFWKFTNNAFDFGTLLNTPITFPISWRKSKIDGVSIRVSTPDLKGFQAYTTIGHTRARYFGPSNGGLIFNSPLDTGVFRIDHDQAFQQTTNLRYQRPHNGAWISFTWRYDSGLVAGAIGSLDDALALTAAQQAAIGFFCGSQRATLASPITSCDSGNFGATRLRIPAAGTEDDDRNPPRIAPRHIFDLGVGTDNLFHADRVKTTLKFTVSNLSNTASLYNFLSTFSGTHFVTPRAYEARLGWVF
jgi:hypothetical protein